MRIECNSHDIIRLLRGLGQSTCNNIALSNSKIPDITCIVLHVYACTQEWVN